VSLWNAFFAVLAFTGACSLAYLIGSFLRFDAHHRRIRNRRLTKPQPDTRRWQEQFTKELRR
jgi:hypothetical protein